MYNYDNYDEGSFCLGMAYAFCEVVCRDVKNLALSNQMDEETYQAVKKGYDIIEEKFKVKSYVETNLISTFLQDDCLSNGKIIVFFYKQDRYIDEYMELKKRIEQLQKNGKYTIQEKKRATIDFCNILSYSKEQIDQLIKKQEI